MEVQPKKSKNNYIKLFRSGLKHHLFKNPFIWHLFNFCLLKANWNEDEPYRTSIAGVTVDAQLGQFVSTIRSISEDTGLSIQQVRTAQKRLEKEGMLTLQTTQHFTLITVCNYWKFQVKSGSTQHSIPQNDNKTLTKQQHIYKNNKKKKNNNIYKNNAKKELSDEGKQVYYKLMKLAKNAESKKT